MAFEDAFAKIKKAIKTKKVKDIEGHLAVQINLTDEDASGILYMEVADNNLNIEPYDYYDRDAMFIVSSDDFVNIMTGKLDYDKAIEEGILKVEGDTLRASELKKVIKKPAAKKTAAAKTTSKTKTATKTTKSKTAKKTK